MATPIGRILLMPKGDWNASTTYNSLDWVRDSGAAWVCKLDNTVGIAPPTLPTTSNANWTLMTEDGTVGGWSSIQNKPFETIGAGLNVNLLKELEVVAKNTYIPTGTSSDRPISGQGVADALTALNDYYTKSDIDTKLSVVVKYAGKKTFSQLLPALLVSTNANNFFLLSDDGYIADATALQMWNDNYMIGDHIPVDSHIAVIAHEVTVSKPYGFVFDDFGGFVEVDEFTSTVSPVNSVVTFSNLNPDYGYKLCVDIPDETASLPTSLSNLNIPKWTKVQRSTNADGTINLAYTVTDTSSQYALRILK